jgi:hypothetical protein
MALMLWLDGMMMMMMMSAPVCSTVVNDVDGNHNLSVTACNHLGLL